MSASLNGNEKFLEFNGPSMAIAICLSSLLFYTYHRMTIIYTYVATSTCCG